MKVNKKVTASALAGALTTITVFAAAQAGLDVPAGVAAAVTTVFATGLGYVVKDAE